MICFRIALLASLGVVVDTSEVGHRLMFSNLDTFTSKAAPGQSGINRLAAEATPRSLLLVGVTDAYGEGSRLATTREISVQDGHWRDPSDEERLVVLSALEGCIHPRASDIRAAFRLFPS